LPVIWLENSPAGPRALITVGPDEPASEAHPSRPGPAEPSQDHCWVGQSLARSTNFP
jgi:hypothetical protein